MSPRCSRRWAIACIVPYLRGFGSTRFLSAGRCETASRRGWRSDVIALMDALKIEQAMIAGFDWGARTADIVAALWPRALQGLVSVSGYLIGNQEAGRMPLPPQAELQWWYQFYFATERGEAGYEKYRHDFAKLIWQLASPAVEFRRRHVRSLRCVFRQSGSRRHRDSQLPLAAGAGAGRAALRRLEARLAAAPVITVPTITLEGDANGAPHPDPRAYARKFSGRYIATVTGGIGHNLPQEAPRAFAQAVVDVDGYRA